MKRFLFIVALCLGLSIGGFSAAANPFGSDSASNQILNELQAIRGIHQESRDQRQRDIIERQRRDSLQNRPTGELASDYAVMAKIEDNTRQDYVKDGWNFYGIVAFLIALFSLGAAIVTWYEQRKTEGNTKKLSRHAQRVILNELLRHLYRNYIILQAMKSKLEDIDYEGYPSEEHLEKMKIPMENINLEAFYGDDKNYRVMHILYLNLRNFNEEVTIASKHLSDLSLPKEIRREELTLLEFKLANYLMGRISDTIAEIWGEKDLEKSTEEKEVWTLTGELKQDMQKAVKISLDGKTNSAKNRDIDVPNSDKFNHLTSEDIQKTKYPSLFDIDTEERLQELCDIFNDDIHHERMRNPSGGWKVRIIQK